MKLLPVALLLSCSLSFAQTPGPGTTPKAQTKAEVKTKGDKAIEKVAAPAGEVVANKESKVFHKPTCKLASKIKPENKTTLASKADAAKGGYKGCKVCKP